MLIPHNSLLSKIISPLHPKNTMKWLSFNILGSRKYRRAVLIILLTVFWIYNAPFESFTSQPFQRYTPSRMAYTSCSIQINGAVTFCDSSIDSAKCFCTNKLALATLTHCYKIGHPKQIHSLMSYCANNGISLSWNDLHIAEETYESLAQYPTDIVGFNRSVPVSVPIRLNESDIYDYGNSTSAFLGIYEKSSKYLMILLSYWIVVFVIACLRHWFKQFFPQRVKTLTGKLNNFFRKYIDLPATFGHRKTRELSLGKLPLMLIPTRIDTFIILLFVALLVFFVNYDTEGYSRDVIFKSQEMFGKRTSAVRTSAILSYLLPLLVLFAGRINILQWLIGWDYATFIAYHRWISRIVVGLTFVHAVNYYDYLLIEGVWNSELVKFYMVCGIHAYHAGLLTLIQGLLCFRRSWYETFLVLHIFLAGVFIVGGLYHAKSIAYVWFYYFSVALWVSDRIVRIFLLFEFGFPRAEVALIADECLKITIPRPDHWETIPGGHVFIQFLLLPIYFWQSHPFTYVAELKKIIIYCKVKEGVTKTIANELKKIPGRSSRYLVGVEGSYGEPTQAINYDSMVFIAGGNGIPGIYAEAIYAANRLKYGQFIKLLWVIREFKSIEWFESELHKLSDTKIETSVYITSGKYSFNEVEAVSDYGSIQHKMYRSVESLQSAFPHIKFIVGRPDIRSMVEEQVLKSNGSTSFVTCGHPHMVDEVRASVVGNIGSKRVDYFEQLQVWA